MVQATRKPAKDRSRRERRACGFQSNPSHESWWMGSIFRFLPKFELQFSRQKSSHLRSKTLNPTLSATYLSILTQQLLRLKFKMHIFRCKISLIKSNLSSHSSCWARSWLSTHAHDVNKSVTWFVDERAPCLPREPFGILTNMDGKQHVKSVDIQNRLKTLSNNCCSSSKSCNNIVDILAIAEVKPLP